MDVSKYIAELLYDFECVVIPGFGGFIVNDKSSTINRINHQFKPPFRNILLNTHLKANDGLLVNQLAASQNISFKEAKVKVDAFVNSVLEQLEKGNSFTFSEIGTIHYDKEKNIVFEQDVKFNYNPDSYGLKDFVLQPVKRVTDEEKLKSIIIPPKTKKSKPVDRKPKIAKEEKKKNRKIWPVIITAGVILLLLSIGWGISNPDQIKLYWHNTTSAISLFAPDIEITKKQNVVNEARYIPRKMVESDKEILARINRNEELAKIAPVDRTDNDNTGPEIIAKNETIDQPVNNEIKEPKNIPAEIEQSGPLYYIIAGSFSNFNNAEKLVSDLKLKGYKAKIADTNANGMFRVAYTGIKRLDEAKEKLYAIRQDDNPDAWLFRK